MPYNIWCIILGGGSQAFSIDINEDENVDSLKMAIKTKLVLNRFDHMLYKVNIDLPKDNDEAECQIVGEISEGHYQIPEGMKPLNTRRKLSKVFEDGPPREDMLHILVLLPPGRSNRKHRLSESEDPSDKRQKLKRKPRRSDPSDVLYPRTETVKELYKMLEKHKFIFVRGTPASGKTSLAYLLRNYIVENHSSRDVCMVVSRPQAESSEGQQILGYEQWLATKGWEFPDGGVLIIDEAQLSYWDDDLWIFGLKTIASNTPYMIILFASYGSAGRDLLPGPTPFRVQEEQLVGLARGPSSSVGLLLTIEETEGVVMKKFPDHQFDESLLKYMYNLTSGHVGAYCDALEVVKKHDSYREKCKVGKKYTREDFYLGFEVVDFLRAMYEHGVFSRGLPTRGNLTNKYAKSLSQVLDEPAGFVVVTEEQDRNKKDPLRQCLERGWLFSERHGEQLIKYRFASPLHERYTQWLLLDREEPIKDPDLQTFVTGVLHHLCRKNLKTREDLKSSSSAPQSIPEAQFQQEFYRACGKYTKGMVTTLPECGTANGRIDFFIRSQKWGIELLRDGNRLAAHNARFTEGEYSKWIQEGKMDDYIMIDFRLKVPTSVKHVKCLYAVSTDSWESMQIYNHELVLIDTFQLFIIDL